MYFFKRFTLPQGRKFSFSKDICITKPHQSFRFLDKTKKDLKKVFLFLYNYVLTFYTAHCRAGCVRACQDFRCCQPHLRHTLNVRVASTALLYYLILATLRHALNVRVASANIHNCA